MSTQEQTESVSAAYVTTREDGEPISRTVLEAVADVTGRAVVPGGSTPADASTPLPPLYEAIDPDALDRLCRSATAETGITVTFTYCGYEVTVEDGDEIVVFET